MRIILAAVAGGAVMFFWSAFAHMVLPLGEVGFHSMPNEAAIMGPMKAGISEPGIYFSPAMENMHNATEAEQAAWEARYKAGPRAVVVYQPGGADPMGAGMLGTELLSNILAALAGALIMAWVARGFWDCMITAGLIGLAGWLSILVSMWNWYGFPANYTIAQGVEQVIGWLLAGVVIAFILKGGGGAGAELS
jgi:hypothetical protein